MNTVLLDRRGRNRPSPRSAAVILACLAGLPGLAAEPTASDQLEAAADRLVAACLVYDEFAMANARSELAELGPSGVPTIQRLMGHDDDNVRWQAVLAADQMSPLPGALLPTLLLATRDPDVDVRGSAVLAVVRHFLDHPRVRAAVARCCRDPHPLVRAHAWFGRWRSSRDAEAIERLVELLAVKQWMVAQQTVEHLAAIGEPAVPPLAQAAAATGFEGRLPALEALGRTGSQQPIAVEVLVAALGDEDPRVGQAAGRAIAALGPVALPSLISLAESGTGPPQVRAVVALGVLGEAAGEALPAVQAQLSADNRSLRLAAIRTAGRLGRAESGLVAELMRLLRCDSPDLRGAACTALANLGPAAAEAVGPLQELAERDPVDAVRQAASRATRWIAEGR